MAARNAPFQKLTQTVDYEVNNEVLATCNSIGYIEDGRYIKEPDCNACLKDLLRFLRSDSVHTFAIRRQLGSCNLIANDLVPIMKQFCVIDPELFDLVLRLLANLTNPALLLFNEEVPTERDPKKIYLELVDHLFAYKQVLAYDVKFWSVVAKHLLRILQMSVDQRTEEDKIMFERILILMRNVLHVPSLDEHDVVYGDDNVHDKLLVALQLAGMYDILLHICQTPDEHEYCFHILEVLSLMFKEQDPVTLAKHSNSIKMCDYERKNDVREMKELLARDKARTGQRTTSFDRFKGSTYVVKNFKVIGDRDLICHKTITDVSEITFDQDKRSQRKAKNRQHMKDAEHISTTTKRAHCSSFEVKRYLRDLCCAFLADSYNLFMKRVRYYLERSSSADNDETYYLWASHFFMQFNRQSAASCELVRETFTAEYLHYLHCLIETYLDRVKTEKRQYARWSKRLHYALQTYRELLFTVAHVHSTHRYEAFETANEIKQKIFYEQEHRELLRTLLLVYDPIKMSDGYRNDLIEANHIFMKLFEYYAKKNKTIVVNRRKRKAKRRQNLKLKKQQQADAGEDPERVDALWEEIANELTFALNESSNNMNDGQPDTDSNDAFSALDLLSSQSKDDQKLNVMKKLNTLLRRKECKQAVKLFRTARYFYMPESLNLQSTEAANDDDDYAFGRPDIQPEEEQQALREILTNELLIEHDSNGRGGEADADGDDDDEEEEEDCEVEYREENLEFSEFVKTYATPKIIYPFCLSLKHYEYNAMRINSYILKMFHRLAFDCCMYAQFFQLSILRIFQQIMNKQSENECYAELIRFSQFIVGKLLKVAAKNDKTFVEILYWKNTREAYELEEGYGSTKIDKTKKNGKRGRARANQDDLSDLGEEGEDANPISIQSPSSAKRDDGERASRKSTGRSKTGERKGKQSKTTKTKRGKTKQSQIAEFGDDDFGADDRKSSDNEVTNDKAADAFDRAFGKNKSESDAESSPERSDKKQFKSRSIIEDDSNDEDSSSDDVKRFHQKKLLELESNSFVKSDKDDARSSSSMKAKVNLSDDKSRLNLDFEHQVDNDSNESAAGRTSEETNKGEPNISSESVASPDEPDQNKSETKNTFALLDSGESSQDSLVNARTNRRPTKAICISDDEE